MYVNQSITATNLNDTLTTSNCADMSEHMSGLYGQFRTGSETVSEMGQGIYESQSPIAGLQTRCGSDYGP